MEKRNLLEKIQANAFGHFAYLPERLGFQLERANDSTRIYCGLGSSMFNITFLTSSSAPFSTKNAKESFVSDLLKFYGGQPFAWWFGPCFENDPMLDEILLQRGFVIETTERAMILDLGLYSATPLIPKLDIKLVNDKNSLLDFISVLEVYDKSAFPFYSKLASYLSSIPQQKLFVGYENDIPVSIGMLFLQVDTAGIFSLVTREDKRGKGYGTEMMVKLIEFAKSTCVEFVTLSASSYSGFRIYEKLGFKSLGTFKCYEWKGSI
jgi:ribosomal protein S18 acetylase RimI-like enzyme